MKLTNHFADFLRDTVNLNQTRIDTLESSIDAIRSFITDSDWTPRVWRFEEQGSWAHGTIIRPVEGSEFDADLLVIIDPVSGWKAADYVSSLGEVFDSSGLYRDKTKVWDYCVTITYAGDRKIDIAPCVRGREVEGRLEVCNKERNAFEQTEPVAYTEWFNTKNGYSGANSFRKVTRLLKYIRDIEKGFDCPSIILTTLIGEQINWSDKNDPAFSDVPTTLKTITSRLDSWLQMRPRKPVVRNPKLASEDFAALMTDDQYKRLRDTIHEVKQKIDAAVVTPGRYDSVLAWRRLFGDKFAKSVTVLLKDTLVEDSSFEMGEEIVLAGAARPDAWHDDGIVDLVTRFGRWVWKPSFDRPSHMSVPIWARADIVSDQVRVQAVWRPSKHSPEGRLISDFERLPADGGIWFSVTVNNGQPLPPGFFVRYRVTNTGTVAMGLGKGRGGFEAPHRAGERWEQLEYRGVHLTEAFIIRESDNKLVGQSAPFHVVIR